MTIDGTGSTDANGNPLTYTWRFTSVPTGATPWTDWNYREAITSFTVEFAGTYEIELIVDDGNGGSDTATVTISTQN